jgi:transcriptional regulator with XRE-family HTH domain
MNLCNQKLRELRLKAHLTQEQMADEMSMSYSNYNRLENGKRKIKMEHISGISKAIKKKEDEVFQMLSHSNTASVSNTINNPHDNNNVVNVNDVEVWKQLLQAKDEIISQKDKIIELLEFRIKSLDN